MLRIIALLFCLILCAQSIHAQVFSRSESFSKIDTLRGSITPERSWWDLTYYNLNIQVFPSDSSISGINSMQFKVLEDYELAPTPVLQIELQTPMYITEIFHNDVALAFKNEGPVYFIRLDQALETGNLEQLDIHFEGKPKVARRAPWDGGFSWTKDDQDQWFIATSNQGEGASLWWPNKDHPYDEPDSLLMTVRIPDHLTHVGNGRLRAIEQHNDGTKSFSWAVTNPINNYGVNINIGNYVNFSEVYEGELGPLDCDYWVLEQNLEKAKVQFTEVPRMLQAFEHWFGPYPFYEDSFKLVEVPYLGMEHQSSVTYGNGYQNGYLGRDLSRTGEGMKFDFIIIHEAGHEWFANNITNADVADMWIHEGFTNYSESLFLEYHYGKESAYRYIRGLRSNIQNNTPIIGPYDVRREGSSDMYYKGNNMLHTIRQVIDNDATWRKILRGLNTEFKHQSVSSQQVESYMSEQSGMDLQPIFDQYLRDIRIPTLTWRRLGENRLEYWWTNSIEGFSMPVDVNINGQKTRLNVKNTVSSYTHPAPIESIEPNREWYISTMDLSIEDISN